MKVALYTRVSTNDQSVDMQLSELKRYCKERGLDIYKEYSDEGVSGTKDRRPALDELMDDARKKKFDAAVCWRFDRFARSTKHLLTALEEFHHLGIDFISYQENIDTSSPLGKAMFTIVAAIAELERSIIVERVRAGIARAKAEGTRLGRPPGSDIDASRVQELLASGLSTRAVAKSLGIGLGSVWRAKQATRKT